MRWLVWTGALSALLTCAQARCEDIGSVLQRSQQQRLDGTELADPAGNEARQVRTSFRQLLQRLHWNGPVELRVSRGDTAVAETLCGQVVVASAALAALPDAERLFMLAHELGHVRLQHGSQMGLLFQKWVPGEVNPQQTDAVAPLLGRDAAELSHRQEFEADAFAMRALQAMGFGIEQVMGLFQRAGRRGDTPTHPAPQRRVAALLSMAHDDTASAPTANAAAVLAAYGEGR